MTSQAILKMRQMLSSKIKVFPIYLVGGGSEHVLSNRLEYDPLHSAQSRNLSKIFDSSSQFYSSYYPPPHVRSKK
jgi:hypothetical protein